MSGVLLGPSKPGTYHGLKRMTRTWTDEEQRRHAEALRECEESLRVLFDDIPVGCHEIDREGIGQRVNRAECALLGFEPARVLGKPVCDLVAPEQREACRVAIRRKLEGTQPIVPFQREYVGRDGKQLTLEIHEILLRDYTGSVVGIRSFLLDVSERVQVEKALRESEERYALAVRGANDGLWDWNLTTGKIYFSPRWKAMLGYEESEISDSPEEWFSRVHPEDLGRLKVDLGLHLEGCQPQVDTEYRIRHRDGAYLWMRIRGLAVHDAKAKAARMAGSQTDITMRKLNEERLLRGAFYDELTGLPNRSLFMERLERTAIR